MATNPIQLERMREHRRSRALGLPRAITCVECRQAKTRKRMVVDGLEHPICEGCQTNYKRIGLL